MSWEVSALTQKDLRKLNRYQLLELLVTQTERADRLEARLEATEQQLITQYKQITSMGSIAEASLQLGGVFEAAQAAADLYLQAAQERAKEIEEAAHQKAQQIIADAEAKAQSIQET